VARLNVGGSYSAGDVKLTIVQAVHSAGSGTPTGVIIESEGLTIYHAGDTALFGDMKMIGDRYNIDLACIPIGGNYTMDADQATAALELLRPAMVFPIHYGTFPSLARDASEFKEKVSSKIPYVKFLELKPGESYSISTGQMRISA
jgi:L-ascorbate metabolism protein UlaG (beta-lactamase superfamily)